MESAGTEREEFVQVPAVGIAAIGEDGVRPTRQRPIARARKDSELGRSGRIREPLSNCLTVSVSQ
jgi:hypothetical protein